MLFMAAVQSEAILIIIIVGVFFFSHSSDASRADSLLFATSLSLWQSRCDCHCHAVYTPHASALFSPQQHAQYAQGTSASQARNCLSSKVSLYTAAAAVMCVSYGAI